MAYRYTSIPIFGPCDDSWTAEIISVEVISVEFIPVEVVIIGVIGSEGSTYNQ